MRSLILFVLIGAGLQVSALAQSALNLTPSRVVGQPSVRFSNNSASPNLVEGRELYAPVAVVIDRTSTPAAVFVSDSGNNRVLGWRDISALQNGSPADLVLGQIDRSSTYPLGPTTARTGGLNQPGALAIDRTGNLYVVDTGNNRIVRFRKPFASTDEIQFPDMVIGQPGFTSNTGNNGGTPSERNLQIASASGLSRTGMAFDAQGNLWFTDTQNHRVLRYPAAALSAGTNQPAADVVLGQPDFITTVPAPNTVPADAPPARLNKTALRSPVGLTIDSDGRLYVADDLARVVVYTAPLVTGREASRVVGLVTQQPGQPLRLEYVLAAPQGLFAVGNRLGVADPGLHRVLIFDPFPEWPAETAELPSPAARTVIGQASATDIRANRGLAEPNETTLASPFGGYWSGQELAIVDTGNNRVLIYPQAANNAAATRVLGQTAFAFAAANLVEGRELFLFGGNFANSTNLSGNFSDGAGVAIDTRSSTPRMYVADTFNNRVLGYRDARVVRPGMPADVVIGQLDFFRTLINFPSNNRDSLTDSGLFRPSGLAVDKNGDLFVADSGNGRVLRFPAPFEQTIPAGERRRANLVLGQSNFNQRITDPSARNMAYPFGIAFTVDGHLLVSDAVHSRVLFFRRGANGDFASGQAAERVIGQPDFFSVGPGTGLNRLNSPRHLSLDTDDRLYLADAGNNRVLVYDRITTAGNDPSAVFVLTGSVAGSALNAPQGVYVSPVTGEIWVANTRASRATRFPRYEQLVFSNRSDYEIPITAPLALTHDAFGNLYVAEGTNRVAMYYNGLSHQIAGNYATRPLSPGAIGILYPAGIQFSQETESFTTFERPLPTDLQDVQVLINEQSVPLFFVSPTQINFQVPYSAPTSGTSEVQVVKKSTGQILAVSELPFQPVSPALFVQGGALEGQLAAINEDGTINSVDNRAARGTYVSLYATGLGGITNPPPDGTAAPTAIEMSKSLQLRVIIGGPDFVPDDHIQYAGLAPGFVGLWQINVKIPSTTNPGPAVEVAVTCNNTPSNRTGPTSTRIIRTTIAVKL